MPRREQSRTTKGSQRNKEVLPEPLFGVICRNSSPSCLPPRECFSTRPISPLGWIYRVLPSASQSVPGEKRQGSVKDAIVCPAAAPAARPGACLMFNSSAQPIWGCSMPPLWSSLPAPQPCLACQHRLLRELGDFWRTRAR